MSSSDIFDKSLPDDGASIRTLLLWDVDGTLLHGGSGNNRAHKDAFTVAIKRVFGVDASLDEIPHSGLTDTRLIYDLCALRGVGKEAVDSCLSEVYRIMIEYCRDAAAVPAHAQTHAHTSPAASPPANTAAADATAASDSTYPASVREHIALRSVSSPSSLHVRALPHTHEALTALREVHGVVHGLVTGNLEQIAEMKMKAVGMDDYFITGGFGDSSAHRPHLVTSAVNRLLRRCPSLRARVDAANAAQANTRVHPRTGEPLHLRDDHVYTVPQLLAVGVDVVVIGDTPHDVAAAHGSGARAVCVCTGGFTRAAFAAVTPPPDAILDDLHDWAAVKAALGASDGP